VPAPVPVAVAEGVYVGTLTGSSSSDFQVLVLESGEFYGLYGTNVSSSFAVAGFVQGLGVSDNSNNSFTSSNVRDFGFLPSAASTLTSTYAASAINGSLVTSGQTTTFNGARPSGTGSFDYNAAATLSSITGVWNLAVLGGGSAAVNIGAGGIFTGSTSGCSFSGNITPRASGKNVFNISLTYGPAPCLAPATTGTGIALSYPVNNGNSQQLIIAGVNSTRTAGTALFGTR
jgi:hypothetical protein